MAFRVSAQPRPLGRGQYADEGNHPSGAIVIAAPGKKLSRVAKRASTDCIDVVGVKSCGKQLGAVFRGQIQVSGLPLAKPMGYLQPNFVTARSDSGPDRRIHITRVRSEFTLHAAE
jgi:hypothetical protein